ncbi:MAG: restriction endonuclease subunit S [Candidatus Poribacteria bacterium]|nr:restriction endonuclease subunit S [Candidatus Poribacteria bacterium]MDE0505889.1 restriction endonuclease subunit S [Candidatus Poribacteria bacterium]
MVTAIRDFLLAQGKNKINEPGETGNMSEMDAGLSELPDGWAWLTVGSAITKVALTGKKLKQKNYEGAGKLPVIDQGLPFIGGYTNDEELKVECQLPVVIFGDHTKVFKYVDFDFVAGADGIKVIRPQEMYYPKLFFYFAQATSLPEKGYARHFQFLEKAQIPLPPLPEQHRIVAKIEELFTKLDAGIDALHKVGAQLKRYRQSVLKAAFEGKLTEAWRAEHQDEIEPTSVLLERVLKERRGRWEAEQLEQMKARGQIPKDDKWKTKYKEPAVPDTSELPELPKRWIWATIEQLLTKIQYGSSRKTSDDASGVPVLRMGNIVEGKIVRDNLKYLPKEHDEFPELLLNTGDLLFNRTNSRELVGKTSVYTGNPNPCSFASYLIRVRFNPRIDSLIVAHYINSVYGKNWILSVVSQQAGQANVNGTKLKLLSVPIPPEKEQRVLVEEIERRLSVADEAEKTVTTELKRAEQLRQSILKKAFSGKLVPQDPNDEPASVLLERIRAEKS